MEYISHGHKKTAHRQLSKKGKFHEKPLYSPWTNLICATFKTGQLDHFTQVKSKEKCWDLFLALSFEQEMMGSSNKIVLIPAVNHVHQTNSSFLCSRFFYLRGRWFQDFSRQFFKMDLQQLSLNILENQLECVLPFRTQTWLELSLRGMTGAAGPTCRSLLSRSLRRPTDWWSRHRPITNTPIRVNALSKYKHKHCFTVHRIRSCGASVKVHQTSGHYCVRQMWSKLLNHRTYRWWIMRLWQV